jgi:tryptophan synthase beta chain
MEYDVNDNGYYGDFGGSFIPEMLYANVEELRSRYLEILESGSFRKEFHDLLRDYAGRPTPLFHARRLSEKYRTGIYLKREDLNHTGSHKLNNTIGQILMARLLGKAGSSRRPGPGSTAWRPPPSVHFSGWNAWYTWATWTSAGSSRMF